MWALKLDKFLGRFHHSRRTTSGQTDSGHAITSANRPIPERDHREATTVTPVAAAATGNKIALQRDFENRAEEDFRAGRLSIHAAFWNELEMNRYAYDIINEGLAIRLKFDGLFPTVLLFRERHV